MQQQLYRYTGPYNTCDLVHVLYMYCYTYGYMCSCTGIRTDTCAAVQVYEQRQPAGTGVQIYRYTGIQG